jgi:hypothetical protein
MLCSYWLLGNWLLVIRNLLLANWLLVNDYPKPHRGEMIITTKLSSIKIRHRRANGSVRVE